MSHQRTGNFAAMTDAWSAMTRGVLRSATAANRAALSTMVPNEPEPGSGTEIESETTTVADAEDATGDERLPASIPSVDHSHPDWGFERTVDDPTQVGIGDTVTFEKTISDEDVRAFAAISGDTNRLHLDDEFAAETRFGERIVHGTLVSGLISAALARLPGLTIYLSQDLSFRGPVAVGDRVSARVEIVEDLGNGQYRLETLIRDESDDETVIDGEAVVLIDELPAE